MVLVDYFSSLSYDFCTMIWHRRLKLHVCRNLACFTWSKPCLAMTCCDIEKHGAISTQRCHPISIHHKDKICRRFANVWSHPSHYPVHPPTPAWSMNGWLTSFSFIVNWPPHSWDKAISDSDLETPRSRSWVWSKGKVIQSAQCHINSLPFHFTSIRPSIPEIELFWNLTLKHPRSRSWVRSKVKVTYCTQNPTNALPFLFTPIGPTIPEIWPK